MVGPRAPFTNMTDDRATFRPSGLSGSTNTRYAPYASENAPTGNVTRGITIRIDRQNRLLGNMYMGYRQTSVIAQLPRIKGPVQWFGNRSIVSSIVSKRIACKMTPKKERKDRTKEEKVGKGFRL